MSELEEVAGWLMSGWQASELDFEVDPTFSF